MIRNAKEQHQLHSRRLFTFITFVCSAVAIGATGLLSLAILSNVTKDKITPDPYLKNHGDYHQAYQDKLEQITLLLEERN